METGFRGTFVRGAGAQPTRAHLTRPRPTVLWRWPGREGLTFNRGGANARFLDGDGVLQAVQDNDEMRGRHHYRDRNGVLVPAALVELSRTNSCLDSEDFTSGNWGSFNQETITADQATAPDGTTTADLFEGDVDGIPDGVSQSVSVSDDSLARAASWFVKAEDNARGRMRLEYIGGTTEKNQRVIFEGIDGDDPSLTDVDGNADRFGIEEVGDGWWRVWVVVSNNGTGNTTARMVCFVNDENTSSHGIYGWGAQLEVVSGGASYPTSYIPTTSSAVTRSAEDALTPYLPDPQDITIYGRLRVIDPLTTNGGRVLQIGANASEYVQIKESSGNLQIEHDDGTDTRTATATISPSVGDELEFVAHVIGGSTLDIEAVLDGGSPATGESGSTISHPTSYTDQRVYVGRDDGGSNRIPLAMRDGIVAAGAHGLETMGGLAECPPEFGR